MKSCLSYICCRLCRLSARQPAGTCLPSFLPHLCIPRSFKLIATPCREPRTHNHILSNKLLPPSKARNTTLQPVSIIRSDGFRSVPTRSLAANPGVQYTQSPQSIPSTLERLPSRNTKRTLPYIGLRQSSLSGRDKRNRLRWHLVS